MASKVILTVFALGAIARIDTAGAGSFGHRPSVAKASPTRAVEVEREVVPLSKADFFAAMARTGTALPEPGAGKVAAAENLSDGDAILDEFDGEDPSRESADSCGGGKPDEEPASDDAENVGPCGPGNPTVLDDEGVSHCDLGC